MLDFISIKLLFSSKKELYSSIKKLTGFYPSNISLYEEAFIHKSASSKDADGNIINNERLEFLGDSILDSIIAEHLCNNYPNQNEGFLTTMRSKLVNREFINDLAKKIGLKNLVVSNMRTTYNTNILGNVFEAFIGAIYLDKGYSKTKKFFITKVIKEYIDLDEIENRETNFKSKLIEWCQKNKKEISFISSEKTSETPSKPVFISKVEVDNYTYGAGKGFSKKEAEQKAAKQALRKLVK